MTKYEAKLGFNNIYYNLLVIQCEGPKIWRTQTHRKSLKANAAQEIAAQRARHRVPDDWLDFLRSRRDRSSRRVIQ